MSPFIREKKDFYAALFDGKGRLVVGSNLPIFGDAIGPILERWRPEGARPCLRCFPPASLPFNAMAPFRANPLFYLERARGCEPPTPTLARAGVKGK